MSALQHHQDLLKELLVWIRSLKILTVKRSAMKPDETKFVANQVLRRAQSWFS
jgi:hypothetical protein